MKLLIAYMRTTIRVCHITNDRIRYNEEYANRSLHIPVARFLLRTAVNIDRMFEWKSASSYKASLFISGCL